MKNLLYRCFHGKAFFPFIHSQFFWCCVVFILHFSLKWNKIGMSERMFHNQHKNKNKKNKKKYAVFKNQCEK